jgi:hypothetical protein
MMPIHPFCAVSESDAWAELCDHLGVERGEFESGDFCREFRNKGFARLSPDFRESLWDMEMAFLPVEAGRFSRSLYEIEQDVREKLAALPNLKRVETPSHAGRKLFDLGALQVEFQHAEPIGAGVSEGFCAQLPKEAGDTSPARHLWGGFSSDGRKSYWTVLLNLDELSDNHQITRRLRRLKQTLNKMFTGPEWLPAAKAGGRNGDSHLGFTDFVAGETLRLLALDGPPRQTRSPDSHPPV